MTPYRARRDAGIASGHDDAVRRPAAELVLQPGELVVERRRARNAEPAGSHRQLVRPMGQREVEPAAACPPAQLREAREQRRRLAAARAAAVAAEHASPRSRAARAAAGSASSRAPSPPPRRRAPRESRSAAGTRGRAPTRSCRSRPSRRELDAPAAGERRRRPLDVARVPEREAHQPPELPAQVLATREVIGRGAARPAPARRSPAGRASPARARPARARTALLAATLPLGSRSRACAPPRSGAARAARRPPAGAPSSGAAGRAGSVAARARSRRRRCRGTAPAPRATTPSRHGRS